MTTLSRLTSTGDNSCHFVKVAKVEFLKYSLLKGKIESETWAGISKAEEMLEERFHDIDQNVSVRTTQEKHSEQDKSKTEKRKSDKSIRRFPNFNLYDWRVST